MAAGSLLALLDDIAGVLDDVSALTKVAARKTAGVLGDDLALNAQQVSGLRPDRELAVVLAVARGSLLNKAVLVPAALAIGAFAPWAVTPLLMLGGLFLCFEGCEKLAHRFLHAAGEQADRRAARLHALADPAVDLASLERERIRGAVRTDFILSAEIIVITLGTVGSAPPLTRLAVLVVMALIMTVGVYGLVAGIVKLDDTGLHLARAEGPGPWAGLRRRLGGAILAAAPWLMKALSVAGTAAMFLVGGGILLHGLPAAHGLLHDLTLALESLPAAGSLLAALAPTLANALAGLLAGAVALAAVTAARRLVAARTAG